MDFLGSLDLNLVIPALALFPLVFPDHLGYHLINHLVHHLVYPVAHFVVSALYLDQNPVAHFLAFPALYLGLNLAIPALVHHLDHPCYQAFLVLQLIS